MIKASEIAEAISALDAAISFISEAHTLTATRRLITNRLISARCKLDWSLRDAKVMIENDLKRKEDLP